MNRKTWAGLILLIALASGIYCYLNFREVNVIDVHQDYYSASIIVDHLPYSNDEKIRWWLSHQQQITLKYNIKAFNENGSITYYFYALGEGYQPLEKKDRICFKQIQPPANCLDKNLLMKIQRTQDGGVMFSLDSGNYTVNKDNEMSQLQRSN